MTEHNHEYGRTHCNVCTAERMRAYRARRKAGESKTAPREDWRADDVDYVCVDRVLQGEDPGRPLHPRELTEIARALAAQGLGTSALAKLTKCNTATARRHMEKAELSTSRERETSSHNRETLKSALLTAGGES